LTVSCRRCEELRRVLKRNVDMHQILMYTERKAFEQADRKGRQAEDGGTDG